MICYSYITIMYYVIRSHADSVPHLCEFEAVCCKTESVWCVCVCMLMFALMCIVGAHTRMCIHTYSRMCAYTHHMVQVMSTVVAFGHCSMYLQSCSGVYAFTISVLYNPFLTIPVTKLLTVVPIYQTRLDMAHLFNDHALFTSFQQAYDSNASASDRDHTRLVSNFDGMMDAMTRAGLLQQRQLPPHSVGVHTANRGGKTMSGLSMMAKGAKILMVGASRKLCGPDRCIAMEDPPGASTTYNRMVEIAKGCPMFAQPSQHIRYGSLGGGHLNQFLTSVNARCPTSEEFLWEHMGTRIVDKVRLCASDPVLDDLCHNGLTWTIIPHSIGSAFPLLADLVQKALNVEHHIGEGETWDQVMHQIATEARCHSIRKQGAEHVDWAKVTKKVRQSLPLSAIDLQCGLVRGLPYMVNKSQHTPPAPTCPTKPTKIRQF
jgi:hypothetical protein